MSQIIREFAPISQAVSANVEQEMTIPYDINSLEIIIITQTNADGRMAWQSGETANGGNYFPINPDYWTPDGTAIPSGTKFYLRSAINNTFKIIYGKR